MAEKNNSIKNWFNKTIKDIGDSINESQIENAYDESHDHFLIYQYSNNIFETAKSVYGEFSSNELVLTYYGKEEFDLYSIVVNEKTNEVFFSVKYLDDTSIEVKNLNFRYREGLPLVLKNVNFKFNPKEHIGVVGRTGAGKSSLTVCFYRLAKLEQGS